MEDRPSRFIDLQTGVPVPNGNWRMKEHLTNERYDEALRHVLKLPNPMLTAA